MFVSLAFAAAWRMRRLWKMRDGRGSGDVLVWLVAKAARESHLEEIEGRDRFLVTHCLMERSRCRTEEVSRRGDWV